ncbi:ROK family transcriptional regulator [Acetobacter senegalensis]|uniref:ROK family transcriptional regulator n=1 Tax=Acetobacter senegalensis TaxID=446692 RepID=UPI00209DC658|nr:ROK family transcriptional regulator [Acetobacter senegalensis]MCP1196475.1 ROK family transcriptional regulator [Acetobacter senegalensis]
MSDHNTPDGAGQAFSRIYNRRLVFELLHQNGPLSRVDIAQRIGLKPQTISGITRELLDQGLIREAGRSTGLRGQPQIYLAPNPEAGYALGLHVDRGQITAVLGDLLLNIVGRLDWSGDTTDPAASMAVMTHMVCQLLTDSNIEHSAVWGLGLVLPTLNADIYEIEMCMPGWELWRDIDLAHELTTQLKIPVLTENDATAAAIGTLLHHSAGSLRNFVLIYIGYGTGAGIVVDGMPVKGVRGNAGEFGLLPAPDGEGVIDDRLSLHAVARLLERPVEELTPEALSELHHHRDSRLMHWMEEAARILRYLVSIMETAFDPETVLLGGALPESILSALVERSYPLLSSLSALRVRDVPRFSITHLVTDGPVIGGMCLPIFVNTRSDFRNLYIRHVAGDERPFDHR